MANYNSLADRRNYLNNKLPTVTQRRSDILHDIREVNDYLLELRNDLSEINAERANITYELETINTLMENQPTDGIHRQRIDENEDDEISTIIHEDDEISTIIHDEEIEAPIERPILRRSRAIIYPAESSGDSALPPDSPMFANDTPDFPPPDNNNSEVISPMFANDTDNSEVISISDDSDNEGGSRIKKVHKSSNGKHNAKKSYKMKRNTKKKSSNKKRNTKKSSNKKRNTKKSSNKKRNTKKSYKTKRNM